MVATETLNTREPSTLLPSSGMDKTEAALRLNWIWDHGSADNQIYLFLSCSYIGCLSSGTDRERAPAAPYFAISPAEM